MRRFTTATVDAAAALVRDGGVLAYPTEAVYGLGCDPTIATHSIVCSR